LLHTDIDNINLLYTGPSCFLTERKRKNKKSHSLAFCHCISSIRQNEKLFLVLTEDKLKTAVFKRLMPYISSHVGLILYTLYQLMLYNTNDPKIEENYDMIKDSSYSYQTIRLNLFDYSLFMLPSMR